MPELPEVETIKRTLINKVSGRTIKSINISLSRLIKWPTPEQFKAQLRGQKIVTLHRRGKYLLFELTDNLMLIVHLRMTGRLYYMPSSEPDDKYTRVVFNLDNGDRLLFSDTRTLGTLYLMPGDELWRISGLFNLGPEPLSADFTIEYFSSILKKRQSKIKAILLNQSLIGGLGNIYVDESLAIAGIHPERAAASLNDEEIVRLYESINSVIAKGIEDGGTTFRDYRDAEGKSGSHQYHLYVYGRKGEPCRKCGATIEYKTVAGRGTHYCPFCQH